MNLRIVAVAAAGLLSSPASSRLPEPLPTPPVSLKVDVPQLLCLDCTPKENRALKVLADKGVTDKKAQAVILGTIKQESKWQPSVCEGGAITSYRGCTRGGYGLIQWTSIHRYNGLGRFAHTTGSTPENFDTQLAYIFKEREWKAVEHVFLTEGLPLHQYENAEYRWIGWGVRGHRDDYTRDYLTRIV
jgi:hypothetical protein